MKKRLGYFFLVLVALAGITAATLYFYRSSLITYFTPVVEQVGVIQIQMKGDSTYVRFKVTVTNKSFLKIGIDTLKYEVSLFGKPYLMNKRHMGLVLAGHSRDTVSLFLTIPHVAILKQLSDERKSEDSASYSINISIQCTTFLGRKAIPINRSAKLKIPQPPELQLESIKFTKVRWKSLHAEARIRITNYSPVNLSITTMSYAMNILNQGSLQGGYYQPITIKPRGTSYLDLPIDINVNNTGKTLFALLMNRDNFDYILSLDATLESTQPLRESFHLALTKSGQIDLNKQ